MPFKNEWVDPEIFITYKNIVVYRTYDDDNFENGPRGYVYTTQGGVDDSDYCFDVRSLDVPSKNELRKHPPYLGTANPDWKTATSDQKKEWRKQWDAWNSEGGGEETVIKAIIKEAIDLGMIKTPLEE